MAELPRYLDELRITEGRYEEATRRILEVSTELHLTWYDFEEIIGRVKRHGYISSYSGIEPDRAS